MTEQITNHRVAQHGAVFGVLESVDTMTGRDGKPYPVVILRRSDGSRRAVHCEDAAQIRALAQAEPAAGDQLSLNAGGLHIDRADNYGEAGMTRPAAADWTRWANAAARRLPGGHDALVPDPVAPAAAAPAPRVRREIRMPNGQMGHTYDPEPVRSIGQVVEARDGRGLEVRR